MEQIYCWTSKYELSTLFVLTTFSTDSFFFPVKSKIYFATHCMVLISANSSKP